MEVYFKFCFILLMSQVECWKPSHPATFSIQQTFPDLANDHVSRSSNNNAIHKDSVDSLLDSFNRNEFADDVRKAIQASQSLIFFRLTISRYTL